MHEIIWDENITSSSEGSTSAEPSRKTSKTAKKAEQKLDQGDRRQSVLVEKLEAQLKSIDSLRNSLSSLDSSAHEIKRPAAEKQQRRQSRLQMLTTGFNLGVLSTTATVNKPSTDRSRDMDLKPRLDLDHDISSPDIHGGSFANLPHDDHVSPTTTDVVEFFPPLEGKAGNNSQRSSRRSSSVLPRRHESNELVPVSVEPTSTTSIVPVTGARKEKGRAQSIPTEVVSLHRRRKSSGTGIAFRRSAHIRRRSSERSNGSPDIESFSRRFRTWSITTSSSSAAARRRLSSDQQEGLFAEDDERTPLLLPTDEDREEEDRNRPSGATERSKSESAVCMPTATGAGTGTGTRLQAIGRVHVNIDPRARKMSVQDFVWQIERMNSSINGTTGSRREKGEEAGEGGAGDGDGEAIPGLVRRDSPRLPSLMRTRRVSTGARIRGKGNGNGNIGGGKVLSEVAEEGS